MHPKTLQRAAAAEAQLVLFQHSVGATVPVLWHGVHCERTQTAAEAQVHLYQACSSWAHTLPVLWRAVCPKTMSPSVAIRARQA